MAPCWLLDIAPNQQYQRFVDLRFVDLLTTGLLSAELGINIIVFYGT